MDAKLRVFSITLILMAAVMGVSAAGQETIASHEEFATAFDFGKRFFAAGNFSASLSFFEKADSIQRDVPAVLFNTALVLVKLERYDEAQQRLDRFLQLHANHVHLENVKKLQREVQFALEVRKRQRQDNDYRSLFNRSRILADKGSTAEALDLFRQAEQIYPNDPALLFNVAALHEENADLEKAVAMYKRYIASDPPNRAEVEARLFDVENEIVDMRMRPMCPYCGEKLPEGAQWCHRCWHGPYDVDAAAWNVRACEAKVTARRTFYDAAGRVRESDAPACMYPGRTLRDFLQYSRRRQTATWKARESEGWTRLPSGALSTRNRGDALEVRLDQASYLAAGEIVATGEVFEYAAHQTPDGIWLLDQEPYAVEGQAFRNSYRYGSDDKINAEQVTYESTQCRHIVTYVASFTYDNRGVATEATIKGGYIGYKPEGTPRVDWDVSVMRQFDDAGRLMREELQVGSYVKTWSSKPSGPIGSQLRPIYKTLKPKRPLDLKAAGDFCGQSGIDRMEEPIDLRALYTLSPALALRLQPGITRVVVDYTHSP